MSRVVVDTGAWIEFFTGSRSGEKLMNLIKGVDVYVPALVVAEIFYVLCRKVGEERALEIVKAFIGSNVKVVSGVDLFIEAGRVKCKVPIALADCSVLALASMVNGRAVFWRREKEIKEAEEKGRIRVKVEYLE